MNNIIIKKKVLIILLIIQLLCCFVVQAYVYANDEILTYAILQTVACSDEFGKQYICFKVADTNGKETSYKSADRIRINGESFNISKMSASEADNFCYSIEKGVAKVAIEDGVVKALNFNNNKTICTNAEYDSETEEFVVKGIQIEKLPIYYMISYDEYHCTYAPAYLDENHYYDIEVYEYAICITEMRSKTGAEVIKLIEMDSVIYSDFTQAINVYCESDMQDDYTLCGELYDRNNTLVCENNSTHNELTFAGLENATETYTIKLWLEDEEGKKISSTYVREYTINQINVNTYAILQTVACCGDFGEQYICFKVADTNGKETSYKSADRIRMNGESFNISKMSASEADNFCYSIEKGVAKVAIEDGVVKVLNFDTSANNLEIFSPSFKYQSGLIGKVYVFNNTLETKNFNCYVAVYDKLNIMKWCDIIPANVCEYEYFPLEPKFNQYHYSQGDYIKIFAWNKEGNLKPLLNATMVDIICE